MKLRFLKYALAWMATAMLWSCDVHQWPEMSQEPEPDNELVSIPLSIVFEPDFYLWEHHYDPMVGSVIEDNPDLDIYPGYPGTSERYSNIVAEGVEEIFLKAYVAGTRQCVAEQRILLASDGQSYDADIVFKADLDPGKSYEIVAWAHLMPDASAKAFYDPADFGRVSIINANYIANTDYRDAFAGRTTVDLPTEAYTRSDEPASDGSLSRTLGSREIRMRRPMGKFELVTTDLSEFLDRETTRRNSTSRARADEYRVVISFPMYYPCSYSILDERLENSTSGVAFETSMTVTGETEASLGFDYVMLNNIKDSGVQTRVDIYFQDGTHVAGSSMFTVPMRRDHHTLLRGAFLSMDGGGGVGIDPGFNGDHVVFW